MDHSRLYSTNRYGCERAGKLESVMMHTPGEELELINENNYRYWLFDKVPDIPRFIDEHLRFRDLLRSQGIVVHELEDLTPVSEKPKIRNMPNITYLHDTAIITCKGAVVSKMAFDARKGEQDIVKSAITSIGIPVLHEFKDDNDSFEGCILLSDTTAIVAQTERTRKCSINSFVTSLLNHIREIILIDLPKTRRYMHPERVFKMVSTNLALAYLPAINHSSLITQAGTFPIEFSSFLKSRGVDIVTVSDFEQQRLACSFISLDNGVIIHSDTALDTATRRLLASKGVEFVFFHSDALHAGGGSLNCFLLTLARR